MIDNREEYKSMFEVEQKLWWYQILHERVIYQIRKQFGKDRKISILDAACGTGGLLSFLKQQGFQNLSGFDYSQYAIEFSKERNLDVSFGDLKNVDDFRKNERYDVICCNDALYFLDDQQIVNALTIFKARLNPNGLILINIHAHEAFSGTHDVAVGSSRRFVLSDFTAYAKTAGLKISYNTYWPFFLSIPIWIVRKWQRRQMRSGKINAADLHSDVNYPGDFINGILKTITTMEGIFLPSAPFGSSLFMVLK
ncbi:Methyltransferase domain-containing protein [Dyadobacter koreensis]|uniref:Methyltransferase domain-containing protein n=1 Tax=Dyadobacter koreensis TaxID=408657 RepID=A0A1H6WPU0_9BACT|nr:class I SAM-dependent methyltransferase [Dyadobacter koreensis]SEJ17214.1 Methyltransferase domain-containing protein [Dyadobacter koreensis]